MRQFFTYYYQKPHLYVLRSKVFFVLLITFFTGASSLFGQEQKESLEAFCGTISQQTDYEKIAFFGNNQLLVDNLIKDGFNIDNNYLNRLGNTDEIFSISENMVTNQTSMRYLPIKAWIYRNNNGTGNITLVQLNQIIEGLNGLYSSQTNIRFYLLCDVEEVNNGNFANNGEAFYDTYITSNRIPGALNVHFVIESGAWGGRAQFPSDNPNFASAVKTFLLDEDDISGILAHEVGHSLGLFHTHHPGRNNNHSKNEDCGDCYQESVSRTRTQGLACISTLGQRKCEVNGDFLCDTPADPALLWAGRFPNASYVNNCNYLTAIGGTDKWGENWQPNVGNIMSYAPTDCFNNFSPLQIGTMIGFISDIGIIPVNFSIAGNSHLCINQSSTYTVNALPGVNTYTWEVPQGYVIISGQGTNSVVVQKNVSSGGTIRVRPNCGAFEATFELINMSSVTIEGSDVVCPNIGYSYQVPFYENATYTWSVTNATIIDGQGTRFPYIIFDGYNGSSLHVNISIPGCTSNIQGTIGVARYPEQQCNSIRAEKERTKEMKEEVKEEESLDGKKQESQKVMLQASHGNMRIFPNIATTSTTIECPDDKELYQLFIFNSTGDSVFNRKVQGQYKLDINNLKNGIYIVYLFNSNEIYQEKLIVQK